MNSVVMISSETCGPCKRLKPVLIDLCDSNGIALSIHSLTGPFDPMVEKYQVRGVPTVVLLKDGEEVDRFVGQKTPADLKQFLGLQ